MGEIYTLEQWRRLRGYSQEELAKRAKVSTKTIWNYEKDRNKLRNASYSTISRLAEILSIKTDQIFL